MGNNGNGALPRLLLILNLPEYLKYVNIYLPSVFCAIHVNCGGLKLQTIYQYYIGRKCVFVKHKIQIYKYTSIHLFRFT